LVEHGGGGGQVVKRSAIHPKLGDDGGAGVKERRKKSKKGESGGILKAPTPRTPQTLAKKNPPLVTKRKEGLGGQWAEVGIHKSDRTETDWGEVGVVCEVRQ